MEVRLRFQHSQWAQLMNKFRYCGFLVDWRGFDHCLNCYGINLRTNVDLNNIQVTEWSEGGKACFWPLRKLLTVSESEANTLSVGTTNDEVQVQRFSSWLTEFLTIV